MPLQITIFDFDFVVDRGTIKPADPNTPRPLEQMVASDYEWLTWDALRGSDPYSDLTDVEELLKFYEGNAVIKSSPEQIEAQRPPHRDGRIY